ncbi:LPXTG cell wall anchor domain-containing protein [Propionimicrobium lymphophilum]|uniref:LPXTG cell wall anchor domain-containing protein n=1 Tax=Propionimicrobium lymphophilum TaxID=33012 RepID=UPI0003F925C6|nr:LPXTG cell wall anchor domain-containing protein [Propionimicrobium lymphophilum]
MAKAAAEANVAKAKENLEAAEKNLSVLNTRDPELRVSNAKATLTELQVELSARKDQLQKAQECVAAAPKTDQQNASTANAAEQKAEAKKADQKAADKKTDAKKTNKKGLPTTGAAGIGLATLGLVAASGAAMVTAYRKRK